MNRHQLTVRLGTRGLVRPALTLILLAIVGQTAPRAQQLDGYVELGADRSNRQDQLVGSPPSDIRRLNLLQRYSLNVNWTLYPNLRLLVGGLFEQNDGQDAGGGDPLPDTQRQRLQPYLRLTLNTPLYDAYLGYVRLDDRVETAGLSLKEVQETFDAVFGWTPERYPEWRLRLVHRKAYDSQRERQDTTQDVADLTMEYELYDSLQFYYRGGVEQRADQLEQVDTERFSNTGRVTYFDRRWRDRLHFLAEYNVNHQNLTTISEGVGGEVIVPVPAFSGLSANTEFPSNVVLEPNPALIDGNLQASAGIDLGLPPPGGDDSPRNLGLDLDTPKTVDTLRVWVDRELPPEVAGFFTWDIYTSIDNRRWDFQATIPRAPFGGPLDPRFELRFGDVSQRYIKVVVRPLDLTAPLPGEFRNIFVTELEAFERTSSTEIERETSQTNHRFNTSLRTQLLENRFFYYEFAYAARKTDDFEATWEMSNGLSFRQEINPTYTVSARAARQDGRESNGDRTTYPYSASLRAAWLPTLQQTLVFSGREGEFEGLSGTEGEFEGLSTSDKSLFLLTYAELYKGVRVDVGVGATTAERPDGLQIDGTQVNANATLIPHRTLAVNLQYLLRNDQEKGGDIDGSRDRDKSLGRISLTFTPFPAVYLFGGYRLQTETDTDDRTFTDWAVSWSPFPNGNLQLSINYNETYRSEFDTVFKLFTPRVRWNITSRWYIQASYQRSETDSEFELGNSDILRFGTRIIF